MMYAGIARMPRKKVVSRLWRSGRSKRMPTWYGPSPENGGNGSDTR